MAELRVHAILTEHPGYGWSVESPQLPELVGGRDSLLELLVSLQDILAFGGAPDEGYELVEHRQRQFTAHGVDFVVRMRMDEHQSDRLQVIHRLLAALDDPWQRDEFFDMQPNPTGDIVFVAMLESEPLRSLTEQLDPRGDVVAVVVPVDQNFVWTTQFAAAATESGWSTLGDYGLNDDSTMAEVRVAMSDVVDPRERTLAFS